MPPQTLGFKKELTLQNPMIRFYASLCVLIGMWHLLKPNHPKLCMDMHNILTTHDVIQICVKNQHAICNASTVKRFLNIPYLERSKLLTKLAIIGLKIFVQAT
jgi:hypothetical protein